MTLSLPEVEPVALNVKPESDLRSADADLSNDYGTPNLLFLYYIPFLPDDKKLDLDAIQDEFQSWNAWELGQAEIQLLGHVKAGSLPSDDTIASRVVRNNYRSKAIEFFRAGSEAWLSLANNRIGQKVVETNQDEVNGAILKELRTLATEHQLQSQFGVILNAINGTVSVEQEKSSSSLMSTTSTMVAQEDFCQDTTFTVQKQDEGGKATKDGFKVEINLSTNSYNFDRRFWRDHRHEGEAAIKMGEPIREQMALNFYVDS